MIGCLTVFAVECTVGNLQLREEIAMPLTFQVSSGRIIIFYTDEQKGLSDMLVDAG